MKDCNVCHKEKELTEFYKRGSGVESLCKLCKKTYYTDNKKNVLKKKKKRYVKNRDTVLTKMKAYYMLNADHKKQYQKEYARNNREVINKNLKKKYLNDPLFKMKSIIRKLIRGSLKRQSVNKIEASVKILGCSYDEFKLYLENQFTSDMNWNNQGSYWELDHKIPISWAKTEQEVYELNHYTNFQPLSGIDNRAKGNRWAD